MLRLASLFGECLWPWQILVRCDGGSLAMLELSCKAFAPPARPLSLIQEIVRDTMRHRFPGAHLGVKSWPSLLQRHEQAAEAAEQWEPPADYPQHHDEARDVCETLCNELKDEGCLQEQRAAMSRLMVAKLNLAMIKGTAQYRVKNVSDWLAWFSDLPHYLGSMVAAGAPHALVKVLRSDMHVAKCDAAGALVNIAQHKQHIGAVVTAGALEAWPGPGGKYESFAGVASANARHWKKFKRVGPVGHGSSSCCNWVPQRRLVRISHASVTASSSTHHQRSETKPRSMCRHRPSGGNSATAKQRKKKLPTSRRCGAGRGR